MDSRRKKLTKQLSIRVEELWEGVSSLPLPEEEKLNACFDKIPVSLFPPTEHGQVIEVSSDTSLDEAIHTLAKNRILSAPVRDVDAPEDASWMDKYLGVIEFAGIVHWVLHQAEVSSAGGRSGPAAVSAVEGNFFEELTSSDLYKNTKVKDIAGSFRWAPFIPIQNSDSLLTLLLLLSKYRIKSLPVVESGEGRIENFITQSAVIHMLSECSGFPWFESLGTKSLAETGLPKMKPQKLIKVEEDQPVLEAFQLMRKKGVGGVPVVAKGGSQIVGNISMRDVQFLLVVPEIYKMCRVLTVKDFLEVTRNHLMKTLEDKDVPLLSHIITCSQHEATMDVILKLDKHNIHRVYVVDEEGNVEGVVTMRDLLSKFVKEPLDYFGEFFLGWAPSTPSPH
ncbi:hypothetical protein GOP47_0015562 [Adiantum capillus-veneris]|uniref:CBS domain-containing protein n=1 Tax=Adiantum capillus-veneris TaxID=13818 RepID=A0A9D4UJY2_ADICA|nr:hypothetical protein GOP47_0015562 [Adiantum capillus-veneris]